MMVLNAKRQDKLLAEIDPVNKALLKNYELKVE
jgi:hypothetical protein